MDIADADKEPPMFSSPRRCFILWTITLAVAPTSHVALAIAACPQVGFTVVEPFATPRTRPLKASATQTLHIHREWLTTTSDITDISLTRAEDGDPDDVLLLIKFTPTADQRLHDATTNRSGMRLAFLFDEEVLSNVSWEGPYGLYTGGTQVSIRHGLSQARRLMQVIQGCTAKSADRAGP